MISKYSVKKPYTVFVSVILIVILGVVSFFEMTTDLLPKMDLPYIVVRTAYPGASPEKVELTVTKPLEKILATTSGVEKLNSVSQENSSVIVIEFNQKINMDSAMIDLSGKIDMVKGYMPDEVGTPIVIKMNPDMMPIMVASVDLDNSSIQDTSKLAKEKIIPTFEPIEGVASIEGTGLVEERIAITLNTKEIDNLNQRVLDSIGEGLNEGRSQLEEAERKVADGKKALEIQSKTQTEAIIDGSIKIEEGKYKLQEALNDLPKLKSELLAEKASLETKRDALEWLVSTQESAGVPVSEEEKKALEGFEMGIAQIDGAISDIDNNKPELEKKLEELKDGQKEIEIGKATLSQELSKATATLATSEAELKRAREEFDKGSKEAYKKANLGEAITPDNVNKILMAQNFSMPAGYIKEGEEQYLVKIGDEFKNLDEIKNLTLFNVDVEGVGEVKIKDIATVEIKDNAEEMYAKINGNRGVLLTFQKQSSVSTSEVSKNINKAMEELEKENPGLHLTPLQDQGVYINIVVDSVLNNLILGGILAVLILYLFLKNIKPTIVIAFSIPISVFFAITMMYFSGVTLNIISLSGLALGVGMLVDNSIVVIENIYRLRSNGVSVIKAAIEGTTQVAGAIAASTLTTVCVFLPIVFTHGISRQLFTDMGLTIAYSLIASLIVALTLVPTMSSKLLAKTEEKESKIFNLLVRKYEKILLVALSNRIKVLVLVLLLLIGSVFGSLSNGTVLMPTSDSNQISIDMEMPKGSTIKETRAMSDTLANKINNIQDVKTVGALEGNSKGRVSLYVLLDDDKKLTSQEVGDLITKETKDLNCKLTINTQTVDMSALGGSGVEILIKGPNLDELKRISKDLTEIVKGTEGTIDIKNGLEDGGKETHVKVDKEKASKYGLTVAQVYQEVSEAIKSDSNSTTVTLGLVDYPIILDESENKVTRGDLLNYKLKVMVDNKEEEIKIGDIATISEEDSLIGINRENQVRFMSVKATVDSSHNVGKVSDEIEEKLKSYEVPKGYSIEIAGEKEAIEEAFVDLIKMISLAIIFIYLIMVAQFQSLLSPFIVLFTIPLAFTGGFLALFITGNELSMIGMLGFLILSGIVVNNGIVFVDYVNKLIEQGVSKKEALIKSGKTRMRPILMTALTTILGLSTMALGMGMGADMVQPMAIVTIGGLIYATILTLVVVPIMYDLLNKSKI